MKNIQHCLATVRVNNTLAMSGEQMALHSALDPSSSWLYLGGLPPNHTSDAPQMDGFVGCMHNLQVGCVFSLAYCEKYWVTLDRRAIDWYFQRRC